MNSLHANKRIAQRLTEAGFDSDLIDKIDFVVEKVATMLPYDTALKITELNREVGQAFVGGYLSLKSNGNQIWAIIRSGSVVTYMLRRDAQPTTIEALKVERIMYLSDLLP